ncbi:UNVERIFIED_CONTAM: hypothetical protein FKN15_040172 [Acipenser sinensis]
MTEWSDVTAEEARRTKRITQAVVFAILLPLLVVAMEAETAGMLPLLVVAVGTETALAALFRLLEVVVEPAGTLPLLVLVGTAGLSLEGGGS